MLPNEPPKSLTVNFHPQERAKEAEEAAATNQVKQQPEEECTIRTNAPKMIFGSEDLCGQCSKNSKEALKGGRSSAHSGKIFEQCDWLSSVI